MIAAATQTRLRLDLRALMGLALVTFLTKAALELAFVEGAMPYAAMSLRGAFSNTGWYLLIAGVAPGAIFAMALLFMGPKTRWFVPATIGAGIALWCANVVANYEVAGLCIANNSLAPLTFAPSVPQTIMGFAAGALFALDSLRLER